MAAHNKLGKEGEQIAEAYLSGKGYRILERNWRSHPFELDLIAEHQGWLIVIEVKTRTGRTWNRPEEAITPAKIRHIVRATHHYLRHHRSDLPVRFDVVAIEREGDSYRIEHFEDAFLAPYR
jgi:putative endonuclease